MSNYVTLEKVVTLASKAAAFPYSQVKRKKIFFESKLDTSESIVLCSPKSKFHNTIGSYWCNLTGSISITQSV